MLQKFIPYLLILFALIVPARSAAQDIEKLVETGKKADIMNLKALICYMERDYRRAAGIYEEIISMCEEIKRQAGDNSKIDSRIDSIILDRLMDSADCYQMMGSLEKARDCYIRAGTLAEKYSDNFRRLKVLCNLALMSRESSDFKQFIIYCGEVEKCVDRIKSLENLPPIELLPQADILNSYRLLSIERSALLLDMGRIDDAMQCLSDERNLEWHRTLCRLFTPDTFNGYFNSVKQTNPEMIENILNIIYLNIKSEIRLKIYQGQCMMARGEYRKALSYFDSVEKYIKSIDVTKISADFDECIAYLREISRNVEPYMKPVVEQTVTKLSSFKDEEVGMEYTAFQIENSIRRAQTNKAMGNLDKALELFRNVLRDSEKLDSYRKSVIPAVLIEMGEIYFSKGDLKSSLENADSAKEALKYAPLDFSTPWRLHTLYGKLSEKEENFAGALASYRQAIDYIERLHSLLYIGKRRERFFGERIEPYEGAIRSLISLNRPAEAFLYVEKAKARSLSEHFGASFFASNSSPEIKKKMESSFHEIYKKMENSENSGRANRTVAQKEALEIGESLRKLTGDLRTISSLRELLDDYANFVCAATISAEDTVKMADDSSVIAEYFCDTTTPKESQRVYLFVITPGSIQAETLAVKPADLENEIRTLREKIQDMDGSWKEDASLLYRQLLGPAAKALSAGKRLIVVPHKALHYLPFSILITESGRALVEERPVIYVPSLTALKFCRDKNTEKSGKMALFCLGNASFGDFSSLPGTMQEADEIEKVFGKAEDWREKNFTRERVIRESPGKSIVHFATHGVLDADNPGRSGLITSDGNLTVEDIMDSGKFRLKSRMLVMSACRTGLGRLYPGDEVEGLTRAFMCAGTPSVISTLWSVSDDSTSELMKHFYENLGRGASLDESLRQAEITLMKKYPEPFHWAPFILTGYWNS